MSRLAPWLVIGNRLWMPCGGLYGVGDRLQTMDQGQLKTANSIRYKTTSAINIPINIFLFLIRVFLIIGDINIGSVYQPAFAG